MDAYLGEIRAVAFSFAPTNWALCNGSLLTISRNTALYSLLGNTYGGDGKTTFALPNLGGQAVVQAGQGAGLAQYALGEATGSETETLLLSQLPPHVHALGGSFLTQAGDASTTSPTGNFLATTAENQYSEGAGSGTMATSMLKGTAQEAGGDQPHANMMPSLVLNYIICLAGIFPPRS